MLEIVTTPRGPAPTVLYQATTSIPGTWRVQRSWRKREKEVFQHLNADPWRGERQAQTDPLRTMRLAGTLDRELARVPLAERHTLPRGGLYPVVHDVEEGPGPHPWFGVTPREAVEGRSAANRAVGREHMAAELQSMDRLAANPTRVQGPDGGAALNTAKALPTGHLVNNWASYTDGPASDRSAWAVPPPRGTLGGAGLGSGTAMEIDARPPSGVLFADGDDVHNPRDRNRARQAPAKHRGTAPREGAKKHVNMNTPKGRWAGPSSALVPSILDHLPNGNRTHPTRTDGFVAKARRRLTGR